MALVNDTKTAFADLICAAVKLYNEGNEHALEHAMRIEKLADELADMDRALNLMRVAFKDVERVYRANVTVPENTFLSYPDMARWLVDGYLAQQARSADLAVENQRLRDQVAVQVAALARAR